MINVTNNGLTGDMLSENRILSGGIRMSNPTMRHTPNMYSILGAKYRKVNMSSVKLGTE